MQEKKCYDGYVTIRQFLKLVHRYTEWVNIEIVNDCIWDAGKKPVQYLSRDVFRSGAGGDYGDAEYERLLKYYGDFHVWNLVALTEYPDMSGGNIPGGHRGHYLTPCLTVHVHFSEIKEAYYKELDDIGKEKRNAYQREYRKRKKETEE